MLGQNIKQLRLEKNITQKELASLIGVSQRLISNYENDSATPTVENLIKIADIFKVSLDFLKSLFCIITYAADSARPGSPQRSWARSISRA